MARRRGWRTTVGVGIIYALAVVLMTLPASHQLPIKLIGNNVDNWIFYWNNWWVERAIVEGRSWFECPYMFYPQGANLVAHSHSFLNSLLAVIVKPLVGPIAAFNLVLLFGLWVGAVGTFLLVSEMTGQVLPALLSGFIFTFAPYHLSQVLAHAHLGSIHWWPFCILFLRRTLGSHQPADALWTGLFVALTVWSGLQLGVLLALWMALYVGWHFLQKTSLHTGHPLTYLRPIGLVALAGIVGLALSMPLLIPVVKEPHRLAEATMGFDGGSHLQTDLLSYVLPPTYHFLLGPHTVAGYERFLANRVAMPYLGYIVVGLSLAGVLAQRRESLFWTISSILWMTLAAGSTLRLNGSLYTSIPLPYRLVGRVFPISTIRAPDRFNLLVVPSLAVLAGLGAAYVAQKRCWLLVPLSLLIVFEYACAPLPMWDPPPGSAFFDQMSREETRYGIVDYPMGYTVSKLWLYYQTLHNKPTVEGHISRYTADDYAFVVSNPLLRALYQVADWPSRLPDGALSGDPLRLGPALQELRVSGVRYILLHKPYVDATLQAHFQNTLPIVPVYEDANLAVYDIDHPMPLYYNGFPVALGPGVALAWFNVQPSGENEPWQIEILTSLSAPRTGPLACKVELAGESVDELELPVTFFEAPPERWQTGAVDLQTVSAPLPPHLGPGEYRWALACPEAPTVYLAPDTLRIAADAPAVYLRRPTEILYGGAVRLQGYRWWTVGTELHITLHWKAERSPQDDYKVFVHLLNADGEVARQSDVVPCNWQCPTSHWQAGDTITDQVVILLAGLPPGEYRLAVGLYDAETEERLPAGGPDGVHYQNAYPILSDALSIRTADHE